LGRTCSSSFRGTHLGTTGNFKQSEVRQLSKDQKAVTEFAICNN
jgi:hypothetical protein